MEIFRRPVSPQALHSIHTGFHSFYTQYLVVDTGFPAYILCLGWANVVRRGLDGEREVIISFARLSFLGFTLALSTLAALGFSPLSVAHAGWGVYGNQPKSPQFRPWSRAEPRQAARWRPQQLRYSRRTVSTEGSRRSSAVLPAGGMQAPLFSRGRATVRKAVPVAKGQNPGVRFRPERRQPVHGQSDTSNADPYQARLQSQFRPAQTGRRATYEELQHASASRQRPLSGSMPYAMVPLQARYGYAGGWPAW